MKWTDEHSNVHVCKVARPELVPFFFEHVNAVDVHNHLCQHCLKLEKKWVTQNAYFCLATTITGMNVDDTYCLSQFHSLLHSSTFKIIDVDGGLNKNEDNNDNCDYIMKKSAGILSKCLSANSPSKHHLKKSAARLIDTNSWKRLMRDKRKKRIDDQ